MIYTSKMSNFEETFIAWNGIKQLIENFKTSLKKILSLLLFKATLTVK